MVQHRVDFKPDEDVTKMRKTLVKLGEKELKGEYLFDGTMLFATRRLDGTVINVKDPAVSLFMDLLIDGQISSFCPDQHRAKLLKVLKNTWIETGMESLNRKLLYTVRKSVPEPSGFQYSERNIVFRVKRSIFQTFWKVHSCPDFLFL